MIRHRAPRRAARVAVTAALAVPVMAGCATPLGADAGFELRVGPLTTQNVLTLCQASGALADAVAEAGGEVVGAEPFDLFAPAAEAMAAGHIDMGSSGATGVLTALSGNPELVVFAVERTDGDTQGIVASADSGIADVAGLEGRTVAVNTGGTGDYLLRKALAENGMTIDDVEPVNLAPADAATALAAGRVDAWATWDQYLVSAQLDLGARLVVHARDVDAFNPSVHVVSRAFLDAHPDAVGVAYDALVACADELAADPGTLADAYREAGASDATAEAVAASATPAVVPADAAFAVDFARLADFFAEQGLSADTIDVGGAAVDATALGE